MSGHGNRTTCFCRVSTPNVFGLLQCYIACLAVMLLPNQIPKPFLGCSQTLICNGLGERTPFHFNRI